MADISGNIWDTGNNKFKNYNKVIIQQNRPGIEQEINESQSIQNYERENLIRDFLGDGFVGKSFKVTATGGANQIFIKAIGSSMAISESTNKTVGRLYFHGKEAHIPRVLNLITGADESLATDGDGDLNGSINPNVTLDPAFTTWAAPIANPRIDVIYAEIRNRTESIAGTPEEIDSTEDTTLLIPPLTETAIRLRTVLTFGIIQGTENPAPLEPALTNPEFRIKICTIKRYPGQANIYYDSADGNTFTHTLGGTTGDNDIIDRRVILPDVPSVSQLADGNKRSINFRRAEFKNFTLEQSATDPTDLDPVLPVEKSYGRMYFDTTKNQIKVFTQRGLDKTFIPINHTPTFTIATDGTGDYNCGGTAAQVEINAAILALPASGGAIYLKPGDYNLTATITVNKPNVTIYGESAASKLVGGFAGYMITLAGGTGPLPRVGFSLYNVTLDAISTAARGIYGQFISGFNVSGCIFSNFNIAGNFPIYLTSGNTCIIRDNQFNNCFNGIVIEAATLAFFPYQIVITSNLFTSIQGIGINIQGFSGTLSQMAYGIVISNNSIYCSVLPATGVVVQYAKIFSIDTNEVFGDGVGYGVVISSGSYGSVSDNTVGHETTTLGVSGIQLVAGSHYITVSNNDILFFTAMGIDLATGATNNSHNIIEGNTLTGGGGAGNYGVNYGISDGTLIHGNIFIGFLDSARAITGTATLRSIRDNTLWDSAANYSRLDLNYKSGPQTGGGTYSLAHGLGVIPSIVTITAYDILGVANITSVDSTNINVTSSSNPHTFRVYAEP